MSAENVEVCVAYRMRKHLNTANLTQLKPFSIYSIQTQNLKRSLQKDLCF